MMTRLGSVLLVLTGMMAVAAFPAGADTTMHARVSYEAGGAMVMGTADTDWGYATVNTLVLPGDTLWADTGALLEAEMAGGSFLRMADRSKAEVVALAPSIFVKGWTGSFYVQRVARSTGSFVFQSPSADVEVDRDAQVRIDIVENGATTVTVRWGKATVRTDVGSPVVVQAGRRGFIDPGYLPSLPQVFDRNAEDDFDRWNRERAKMMAVGDEAIPKSYRVARTPIGAADLVNYGEWVYVDNTQYWRPTVAVNYVPYRHGGWSYVPVYGHVWVGDYPFSYVTSHYGRWSYFSNYGWCWTYRDVWAPAWVAAVRSGPNFYWTPLDPFNRPVYIGGPHYVGSTSYAMSWDFGTMRFTLAATSYCPVSSISYGYGHVRPVTPSVVNVINTGDVNIWNIYGNNITINNFPWVDGRLPVREYKPQRVVRGPEALEVGDRTIRAVDRATRLETSAGRSQFTAVDRTGARQARTTSNVSARTADVRRVAVDAAREQEGIPTSQRLARAVGARADADTATERSPRQARAATTRGETDAGGDPAVREDLPRTVTSRSLRGDDGADTVRNTRAAAGGDAVTRTTRAGDQPPAADRGRVAASRTAGAADADETEAGRTVRARPDAGATTERSAAADRTERTVPPVATNQPSRVTTTERTPVRERATADQPGRAATTERAPTRERATTETAPTTRTPVDRAPAARTPATAAPVDRGQRATEAAPRTPVQQRAPSRVETPQATPRTAEPRAPQSVTPRSETRPTTQTPTRTPSRSSGRVVDLDSRSRSAAGTGGAPAPQAPTAAPNRTTARVDATPRTAPPAATPRTAAPQVSAPSARIPQSATVAPRQTQAPQAAPPQRQIQTQPRQIQTQPRQIQAPQVQAPQQRQIQAPRVQAPQQRQIQAPRAQAPQPSQIQAPRASAPRIEAPPIGRPDAGSAIRGGGIGAGGGASSNRSAGGRTR